MEQRPSCGRANFGWWARLRTVGRIRASRAWRAAPNAARRTLLNLFPALMLTRLGSPGLALAGSNTQSEVEIGQVLRNAPLQGLNGPSRNLSDYLGRPLIINVWASWCGPCRQEMKSLERLTWQEHAVPFTIIGISTDDDPDQARQLLTQTNATISHFIDSHLLWEHMLGATTLPLTVLVDLRGRVIDKVHGERRWDGPEAFALIARAFPAPASARKPADER
jgi:thiol-disulfide isomerase/thioredoxin